MRSRHLAQALVILVAAALALPVVAAAQTTASGSMRNILSASRVEEQKSGSTSGTSSQD